MKKTFAILAIAAVGLISACKKESIEPTAPLKLKSIGDIKEHSGWDNKDSTGTGNNGNP